MVGKFLQIGKHIELILMVFLGFSRIIIMKTTRVCKNIIDGTSTVQNHILREMKLRTYIYVLRSPIKQYHGKPRKTHHGSTHFRVDCSLTALILRLQKPPMKLMLP